MPPQGAPDAVGVTAGGRKAAMPFIMLTVLIDMVSIGLISPPVGMNLFVLNSLLDGVSLKQIFRGVWLFVLMLVIGLVVLLEVPALSLWLPSFMN